MEWMNRLRSMEAARSAILVDVFTWEGAGGNPCPVVMDATGMSQEAMRSLAEAHGHESAFVVPVADAESDFTLRFFVPAHEMEMCGHATLGTLWLLRHTGVLGDGTCRIRTLSGIVRGDVRGGEVRISQPAATLQALTPDDGLRVLNVLGIKPADLATPILCNASTSRPKTLIHLASAGTLHQLMPDFGAMSALCGAMGSTGLYPFVQTDTLTPTFEARQFPRASGYPEDAATGIAAAALFGALPFFGIEVPGQTPVNVMQGRAMGWTSMIRVSRDVGHADDSPCWLSGVVTLRR